MQINTAKNHGQCRTIDLNRDHVVASCRGFEPPFFQSFRPHDETVMVPIEDLATVLPPIKEDEIVAGHYILPHRVCYDGMQAIKLLAHIGWLRVNENTHGR
jgi:hypothetical protein